MTHFKSCRMTGRPLLFKNGSLTHFASKDIYTAVETTRYDQDRKDGDAVNMHAITRR